MACLYAGASKVLFLDPELQLLRSENFRGDNELLTLYIKISPWMARSWPLQEGALAESLFFRPEDRSILLGEISRRDIGLPALRILDYDTRKDIKESTLKDLLPSKFTDVWNGLVNRSTSQPDDVPAIIGALANLRAKEVLELVEEKQHMKEIIRAQTKVPLAIFYQPNCIHNAVWIPEVPSPSFTHNFIYDFYGTLRVTEKGFVLKNPLDTVAFVVRGLPVSDRLNLLVDKTNIMYFVHPEPNGKALKVPARQTGNSRSLFILSVLCFVRNSMYQGARSSITEKNPGGVKLKFEGAVA